MKKENKKITLIGGQALMEGVMMRGRSSVAMAVRTPDGDIVLDTKRLKNEKKWYKTWPVVRGITSFIISLITGVTALTKSAEVSFPEEETPSKGWMAFAVVLGLALGVGIFIFIPSLLSDVFMAYVFKAARSRILISSLLEGALRIIIFILYLTFVSRMKDIRRTFMYHGAEHRTINCFESGMEMTVENVQKCSARHNRCGTTFLFFVMIISIFIFSFANYLFDKWGITQDSYGAIINSMIRLGIRLALLPLVAGLSYELLRFLALLPDNVFVSVIRAPGLFIQRLTTYPPDDGMAEVALKSFMAVYNLDNDENAKTKDFYEYEIKDVRDKIAAALKEVNADKSETDWILCDVLGVSRSELASYASYLNYAQFKRVREILSRRRTAEPLWYILGYTDFYGERLIVNNGALIPRPETELLAEKAIEEAKRTNAQTILDLCTGSGCIAAALKKHTFAQITAADVSEKALALAAQNLESTGVTLVKSDMFLSLAGQKFDIIVSNPPYVETAVIETLEPDVKNYEPLTALDGGADGLDFYRVIAKEAPKFLNADGMLFLEIGYNQAGSVKKLLENDFTGIKIFKDYSGNDRIITAALKKAGTGPHSVL